VAFLSVDSSWAFLRPLYRLVSFKASCDLLVAHHSSQGLLFSSGSIINAVNFTSDSHILSALPFWAALSAVYVLPILP
jgi:hypothetical protein